MSKKVFNFIEYQKSLLNIGFPIAIPLRAMLDSACAILLRELRYNCEQGSNKIFAELRGIASQVKICVARRSSDSERIFSIAGRFATKIRNRLSGRSLDNFTFGHSYFKKLDTQGILPFNFYLNAFINLSLKFHNRTL